MKWNLKDQETLVVALGVILLFTPASEDKTTLLEEFTDFVSRYEKTKPESITPLSPGEDCKWCGCDCDCNR